MYRGYLHLFISLSLFVMIPDEGWAECRERPACSEKDYFQIHTPCDSDGKVSLHSTLHTHTHILTHSHTLSHTYGHRLIDVLLLQTQVTYRWVEPQICVENKTGAVTLPPTGERAPCPPCNPGYYNTNDSTCFPCPHGTHSDGTSGNNTHTVPVQTWPTHKCN